GAGSAGSSSSRARRVGRAVIGQRERVRMARGLGWSTSTLVRGPVSAMRVGVGDARDGARGTPVATKPLVVVADSVGGTRDLLRIVFEDAFDAYVLPVNGA